MWGPVWIAPLKNSTSTLQSHGLFFFLNNSTFRTFDHHTFLHFFSFCGSHGQMFKLLLLNVSQPPTHNIWLNVHRVSLQEGQTRSHTLSCQLCAPVFQRCIFPCIHDHQPVHIVNVGLLMGSGTQVFAQLVTQPSVLFSWSDLRVTVTRLYSPASQRKVSGRVCLQPEGKYCKSDIF